MRRETFADAGIVRAAFDRPGRSLTFNRKDPDAQNFLFPVPDVQSACKGDARRDSCISVWMNPLCLFP